MQFIDTHTQSPVTAPRFDGQVSTGLDDRFDLQLVTEELLDNEGLSYIGQSYHAFGNDGTHPVNGELDDPSNTTLTPDVLAAIASASDHIPVVADYQLPAAMDVTVSHTPLTAPLGRAAFVTVTVRNIADVVNALGADELDYSLSVTGDLSGFANGSDPARGGVDKLRVTLDTATLGLKTGLITVATDSQAAANNRVRLPMRYEVILPPPPGDANNDGLVSAADLIDIAQNFGNNQPDPDNGLVPGDANGDGFVTGADLLTVQRNFGLTLQLDSSVPEPATLLLCVPAVFVGLRRSRERRSTSPQGHIRSCNPR